FSPRHLEFDMSTRVILRRPVSAVLESANPAPSQVTRRRIPDEYIVAYRASTREESLQLPEGIPVDEQERLLSIPQQGGGVLNLVRVKSSADVERALRTNPAVAWVGPNYAYDGDPREEMPKPARAKKALAADPRISEQYHHQVMGNYDAWK